MRKAALCREVLRTDRLFFANESGDGTIGPSTAHPRLARARVCDVKKTLITRRRSPTWPCGGGIHAAAANRFDELGRRSSPPYAQQRHTHGARRTRIYGTHAQFTPRTKRCYSPGSRDSYGHAQWSRRTSGHDITRPRTVDTHPWRSEAAAQRPAELFPSRAVDRTSRVFPVPVTRRAATPTALYEQQIARFVVFVRLVLVRL